jgi:hypothetical protein
MDGNQNTDSSALSMCSCGFEQMSRMDQNTTEATKMLHEAQVVASKTHCQQPQRPLKERATVQQLQRHPPVKVRHAPDVPADMPEGGSGQSSGSA